MNTFISQLKTAIQFPDIRKKVFVAALFSFMMVFSWHRFWVGMYEQDALLNKRLIQNCNDDLALAQKTKVTVDALILKNDILYDRIRHESSRWVGSLPEQLAQLFEVLPIASSDSLHCLPGEAVHKEFYDKLPIELELYVFYDEFKAFIELLITKKIFYQIKYLAIESQQDIVQVHMKCVLYSIVQETD